MNSDLGDITLDFSVSTLSYYFVTEKSITYMLYKSITYNVYITEKSPVKNVSFVSIYSFLMNWV